MGKLYGVVLRLQDPEITANCYGNGCGRGIFAALFDDDLGALVPCAQEECPHLEKQMDEPLWKDGEGRDVYLRRLKSLPANDPNSGAARGLIAGGPLQRRVRRWRLINAHMPKLRTSLLLLRRY